MNRVRFAVAAGVFALGGVALADASFNVSVDAPAAKKAAPATAHVKITPGPGFHVNKEYPLSLTVTPPTGVSVAKARLTAHDPGVKLDEKAADIDVQYTATEAGKKTITGELRFAVCSANSCDPKKASVTIPVDVK